MLLDVIPTVAEGSFPICDINGISRLGEVFSASLRSGRNDDCVGGIVEKYASTVIPTGVEGILPEYLNLDVIPTVAEGTFPDCDIIVIEIEVWIFNGNFHENCTSNIRSKQEREGW